MGVLFQMALFCGALFGSSYAYAGVGVPKFINFYEMFLGHEVDHEWQSTAALVLASGLVLALGFVFRAAMIRSLANGTPEGKLSVKGLVELVLDFGYDISKDNCGESFASYFPILAGAFLFILINNLMGLVPGFPPATENMSTSVGFGLIIFLVYNYAGFKEHGIAYFNHFAGPIWWLAPVFFGIEMVSHGSRPLSLGLRLAGNLFGDHLLLGVFSGLTYFVVPSLLMFLGLMVACIQSYIFTLLAGIYISMAISHNH